MTEWGPQLKVLQAEQDRGRSVPALDNRPEIETHLIPIWDGYSTLDAARHWGHGFPQPIALQEIEAYVRMKGWTRREVDELIGFVQYLDGCYLRRMAQRNKGST